MAKKDAVNPLVINLTGRLVTAYDATKIVQTDRDGVEVNFKSLKNMMYTDRGIRGMPGMTKINSDTALTSYPRIENIFQFRKTQPDETHVVVQAFDSNEDNSKVFKNDTVIPNIGDFNGTAIHTDSRSSGSITVFAVNGVRTTVTSAGHGLTNGQEIVISGTTSYNGIFTIGDVAADTFVIADTFVADDATGTWATRARGRFSTAPLAHLCYCNGRETKIWGGDESKVAGFVLYDNNATTFNHDYTTQVQNTKNVAPYLATMKQDGAGVVSFVVGSVLPLDGIKFYIGTANATSGTLTVSAWNGTGWSSTSATDGTASGGVPFAKTGSATWTFDSSIPQPRMLWGTLGFWYRVQITNCDNTATLYHVTLRVPFQTLRDLWDNVPRQLVKFFYLNGANYEDYSINVSEDSFFYLEGGTGSDTSTYFDIGGKASPSLYFGSLERLQGFQIKLIPGQKNAVAATTMTVSYWDGAAWQALTITDGTKISAISLAQTGYVTWQQRNESIEFKQSILGEESLYYYKVSFDKTLTVSPLNIFFISSIPSERTDILDYKFSLNAKNRLLLFSDQAGDKNKMIASATGTVNVFNGTDSGDPVFFGSSDVDLEAAVEIFARFSANLQSLIIVCQRNSTFVLFGDNPEDWRIAPMPVSNTIGCAAPLTMKASPIGFEFSPLNTKQVAIWLHSNGVYMYDIEHGLNVISGDIQDLFDQDRSGSINLNSISRASAGWNVFNGEYYYHLSVPTGTSTTNNKEIVFDLKRHKWFSPARTPSGATNKDIQAFAEIVASDGSNYTYAVEDNGYIQRLNNGTDYDGNNIETEFETADIALQEGNTLLISKMLFVQMPQVAKTVTTNTITCTHYADGQSTGSSFSLSPVKTGRRIAIPSMAQGVDLEPGVFHSLKAGLITSNETVPFEPLYLSVRHKFVREDNGEVS